MGGSCHIQQTILFILMLNILKLYELGYNNNTLRACASEPGGGFSNDLRETLT